MGGGFSQSKEKRDRPQGQETRTRGSVVPNK
jgi:hypothetical protein